MKLSFALVLLGFAAATYASCPNDCNHHGLCNQYSACECYRNWMGNDCSQRVCPFGHAFVDTPQGDLNADGKVDRPDVYILYVDTGVVKSTPFSSEFKANTMIFLTDVGAPSIVDSVATSVESVLAVQGETNWVFPIPVTIPDHNMASLSSDALFCISASYAANDVTSSCVNFVTGDAPSSTLAMTWTENEYTYPTQFTNADTWELYPLNHAKGKASNELSRNFAEAHFYTECSGKGTCNRESGQCECYPGYEGVGCSRTSCPNECSGHGVCQRISDKFSTYALWDRKKTQLCTCDSGYTGIDCSQRICPKGNDPITRPTSDVGNSDNEDYFAYLPHSDGQEPEIQTFGYVAGLSSGSFALEFEDEFGDKWTTKTMNFLTANGAEVEAALEALPNNVVEDVSVSYRFLKEMAYIGVTGTTIDTYGEFSAGECVDYDTNDNVIDPNDSDNDDCLGWPRMFQVTFLSNSGNVPKMGVRYSVVEVIAGTTETDSNGVFASLVACTENDLASESSGGDSSNVGSTEQATCVFNDVTQLGLDGYTFSQAYDPSVETAIKSIGFEGAIQADLVGDDYATLNTINYGIYYNGNGNVVVHNTGRDGSQENALCSNRGICDYGTGMCSCFNGFTDDDCSVQNALAMY